MVYDYLRMLIEENKFNLNVKLPSENELMMKFKVSRVSVRTAISKLLSEGLVETRRGSGTYVNKNVAMETVLEKTGYAYKIALILQGGDKHANKQFIMGVKKAVGAGYDVRVFYTENKFANERNCMQSIVAQKYDGIIVDGVMSSLENPNLDCYLDAYNKNIHVVFYNNYYRQLKFPKIIQNDVRASTQLMEILIKNGHDKIAGIFLLDNYQSMEKFKGYSSSIIKHNLLCDDKYTYFATANIVHRDAFIKELKYFLKQIPKCSAIICVNYVVYQYLIQAINQMGKKVPEDYSVVLIDYSKDDVQSENVTCTIKPSFDVGLKSGEAIDLMIADQDYKYKDYSYVFSPIIYIGDSVKNLNEQ